MQTCSSELAIGRSPAPGENGLDMTELGVAAGGHPDDESVVRRRAVVERDRDHYVIGRSGREGQAERNDAPDRSRIEVILSRRAVPVEARRTRDPGGQGYRTFLGPM